MNKYYAILMISLSAVAFSKNAYAVKPLSCQMFTLIAVTTANLRDQGRSKEEVRAILNKGGDLTKKEINTFLDMAFVKFKNRSPDEIENIVVAACSSLK